MHNDCFRNMGIELPRAVDHSDMGVDDGIARQHDNGVGTSNVFVLLRSKGRHLRPGTL